MVWLFIQGYVFVVESNPRLEMNATVGDIVDGEAVTLSCSLNRYRTFISSPESIHVRIDHPGAEEIDSNITRNRNKISSVVTVIATSSKHSERSTQFGPVQCKVIFAVVNDPQAASGSFVETARNPVQFTSNEFSATPILRKCVNISVTHYYLWACCLTSCKLTP